MSGTNVGIVRTMNGPSVFPATRLLVVDDHAILREGLLALFEREEGMIVVGSANNGEEAIVAARHLRPDVIIMDLVMPDLNGIDAAQRILAESPEIRIITLSGRYKPEHVLRAMRTGIQGYVVKSADVAELVQAVKAVAAGNRYVSSMISSLCGGAAGAAGAALPKSPYERLSAREREVLRRIVAGSSSAAIAQDLSLSRKTVDTYRGRLMVKLGVSNRSELIRLAIENELTAP